MVTLAALIGQMEADGGDWIVEAPENWSQGRTLYGGITAAQAASSTCQFTDRRSPKRSCSMPR